MTGKFKKEEKWLSAICAVYKSKLKPDSYLFVENRDDFSRVPEALLTMFGAPELVMMLPIDKRDKLAFANIVKVKQELIDSGYYLQLPPPKINLLEEHKKSIGYKQK